MLNKHVKIQITAFWESYYINELLSERKCDLQLQCMIIYLQVNQVQRRSVARTRDCSCISSSGCLIPEPLLCPSLFGFKRASMQSSTPPKHTFLILIAPQ